MTKFLFVILASCFLISNGWAQKSQSKPNPPKAATAVETKKVNIEKYAFKVSLKNNKYTRGVAYLCFHMGKNLNIEDSAEIVNGVAEFKADSLSPGGIYAIVFPGKSQTFDFFVSRGDTAIQLDADADRLQDVKITGAPENELFHQYQSFVSQKGAILSAERTAYQNSKTAADSATHLEIYNKNNQELISYRDQIMKEQPNSMMTAMLYAMKEPEILNKKPITRQDTIDNYNAYKAHYWDGVTFMDERVIRTPFFLPKLERYYDEILPQASDSIIQDLDYKLLLARSCQPMYRFMLNWLTDKYINPKIMGQDAIFVHLFNKYHSKGLTPWLNEKQLETISRRAYMQMSNLIGAQAADLNMVDSTGKPKTLFNQAAEYTFVVFWDPTCGHCKEEIPRIDSFYRASWKEKGMKIYAVLSDNDKKTEWVNYLKEKKLSDWINVYETKEAENLISSTNQPSYKQLYDVIQTPTIFLLDKEKRIIAKKLGPQQINDLLKTKWANKK
jgi:thiol-disulfide isomerase/thioredoxin